MISKNGNVIDFESRRAKKSKQTGVSPVSDAPVVDMTERRNEIIRQERRQVKRTILTEFIGGVAVVPDNGLMKVSIYDISDNGIAFDTEGKSGFFKEGEEVAMRVYMNHQTYFPFLVKIQNVRAFEEEGVFRHGANFVTGAFNTEALHYFVKFIESVSASLKQDQGDVMVSNLKD